MAKIVIADDVISRVSSRHSLIELIMMGLN